MIAVVCIFYGSIFLFVLFWRISDVRPKKLAKQGAKWERKGQKTERDVL